MQFLPLGDIKDQKFLFKMVRDMITQSALENGMLTRRVRGEGAKTADSD